MKKINLTSNYFVDASSFSNRRHYIYIYISHGVSPLLTLALIQDRIMNPSNAFVLHRLVGPGYWNMLVFGAIKTLNAKRRCKVFAYSLYIYISSFSFFFFSLSLLIIFSSLLKTWMDFISRRAHCTPITKQ